MSKDHPYFTFDNTLPSFLMTGDDTVSLTHSRGQAHTENPQSVLLSTFHLH